MSYSKAHFKARKFLYTFQAKEDIINIGLEGSYWTSLATLYGEGRNLLLHNGALWILNIPKVGEFGDETVAPVGSIPVAPFTSMD